MLFWLRLFLQIVSYFSTTTGDHVGLHNESSQKYKGNIEKKFYINEDCAPPKVGIVNSDDLWNKRGMISVNHSRSQAHVVRI